MYNHFMMFVDEKTAQAALHKYVDADGWDMSIVIPNQRVILRRAVWDDADRTSIKLISPEVVIPGYFVTVTLPEINDELKKLPDNACRLIGVASTGDVVYWAPDMNMELIASAIIEPVPFGSTYKFGSA